MYRILKQKSESKLKFRFYVLYLINFFIINFGVTLRKKVFIVFVVVVLWRKSIFQHLKMFEMFLSCGSLT